jgi:hypothetical protein
MASLPYRAEVSNSEDTPLFLHILRGIVLGCKAIVASALTRTYGTHGSCLVRERQSPNQSRNPSRVGNSPLEADESSLHPPPHPGWSDPCPLPCSSLFSSVSVRLCADYNGRIAKGMKYLRRLKRKGHGFKFHWRYIYICLRAFILW